MRTQPFRDGTGEWTLAVKIHDQKARSSKRSANPPQPKIAVPADFAEPRTIRELAEEQRQSMAAIREPLEDVQLPPDE